MTITPEERATKLVRTNAGDWSISGLERGQMVLDIATAIREAVEARQEELASMIEEASNNGSNKDICDIYSVLAKTIRYHRPLTPEAES